MLLGRERAEPAQRGFPAWLHLKPRTTTKRQLAHALTTSSTAAGAARPRTARGTEPWGWQAVRGEALPARRMGETCVTPAPFPALAGFCVRTKGAVHTSKAEHMPKHFQRWRYLSGRHMVKHKWVIPYVSFPCNFMAEGI